VQQKATQVVGRRVLAYILDSIIVSAIVAGLWFAFTSSVSKAGHTGGIVIGNTRHGFTSSGNRTAWIAISAALAILLLVVLPGLRGWSPGKLIAGIRLVNAEGRPPGIMRSLLREILWVVDGLPGLNLVGFVTALATKANQRVGDLVARTYVVRGDAVGSPIGQLVPEVAGFAPGVAPGGPPAQAQPTAPAQAQPAPAQPAGWYPDPRGEARMRWWDGQSWTDNTQA
jgi:uncharacterized RDD family membrane protein YckC